MDLKAQIKQKNDQLLVQNSILQQYLRARACTPRFSSYLLTFVIAPMIAGVITQRTFSSRNSATHPLYRALLSSWHFWSLF